MKLFRRSLAALGLILLMTVPAAAKPALWVARDADTTIYLFGTVHVLPKDAQWHYPALDKALAESDRLYVELVDDDQASMQPLIFKYGLDMAHPLSGKLDQADRKRLQAAAVTAGLPGGAATLEPMRPWMAAIMLTVAPLIKAGFDPKSGVDKVLRADFAAAGKPVDGLENAEQQIRFFADMKPALELAFLHATLEDFDKAVEQLRQLVKDWSAGRVDAIAHLEIIEMRDAHPALYRTLLVDRNGRWAGTIADMLKTPGTVFIAVGAAHLAGPDSVQAQLRKRGVATRRVR